MDLQTLCIVLILAGVITMLVRSTIKAFRRSTPKPKAPRRKKHASGAFALDDALDKINETIRILQDNLGPRAPGRHDPEGARFYVAYMVAMAHEIGRMNDVEGNTALLTPIQMEMIRLGLPTKDGVDGLNKLLLTSEGQQGFAAGELDGRDACNPTFRGVYFERIQTYFNDAEVRGPR